MREQQVPEPTVAILNSEPQEYVGVSLDDLERLPIDSYTEKTIEEYFKKQRV